MAKPKGSQSSNGTATKDDIKRIESVVATLAEKVNDLVEQRPQENKLATSPSPDAAMRGMHQARVGDDPVNWSDTQDRKYPQVTASLKEGDFVTINPECALYGEYMVIYENEKPQPVGVNATCEVCGNVWTAKSTRCKTTGCKGALIREEIPQDAVPAIGRIRKKLYVKKRGPHAGEWKYLIWFDGFGTKDSGGEGLMESELEIWRPSKN